MIPILILGAGSSSRMRGRDKLQETIEGVPLLRMTAQQAVATGQPVFVTLPQRPHPRYDALEGLDITAIPVPDANLGMSASLKRGVANLPAADAALVVLADMPELTRHHMQDVIKARAAHPEAVVWRGADSDGRPGHPVLLDASLFPQIAELQGDSGAQKIIAQAVPRVHLVQSVGAAAHIDLDTPEAWETWRQSRDAQ